MRILLVMIEPPLPFGNAASRWFYVLLRGLVRRGHEAVAFASCQNPADIPKAAELFPAPQYQLHCYPTVDDGSVAGKLKSFARPMSYLFADALKRDLSAEIAKGYDVLHLEQLWGAWLAPHPPARTIANVHYLFDIDQRDAWLGQRKRRLVHRRILQAERSLLRRLQCIAALTPRLAERIREINPEARVFTMPLGIDTKLYPFTQNRTSDHPTVGLIGSFNWGPSYSAGVRLIRELWPRIKQRVPTARLLLVGRRVREALGEYAGDDIFMHEDVPDALPYFQQLDVLLYAPPIGSGMKIKVLESFAMGTPVVTNDEGIEGINAIDGVHVALANDNDGLVERTVRLLNDPALRDRQRAAARALVEEHFGSEVSVNRVQEIYQELASERLPAARAALV